MFGNTALHTAAEASHTDTVRLLLDRNAKTGARNCIGRTPLATCMREGDEATVTLLLQKTSIPDVVSRNIFGDSALHFAIICDLQHIVKLMVANIDINEVERLRTRESIEFAVFLRILKSIDTGIPEQGWINFRNSLEGPNGRYRRPTPALCWQTLMGKSNTDEDLSVERPIKKVSLSRRKSVGW